MKKEYKIFPSQEPSGNTGFGLLGAGFGCLGFHGNRCLGGHPLMCSWVPNGSGPIYMLGSGLLP